MELSGRAKADLLRQQRVLVRQIRELQAADRLLGAALVAADAGSQRQMAEAYLDSVQELRVSLQRLESFLLKRLTGNGDPRDAVEREDGRVRVPSSR